MLEAAIIIALMVYFIKVTTWEGMIFEDVGVFLERFFGEYWSKPVIGCPICMTPWWGLLLYTIGHFAGIGIFSTWSLLHIIYVLFTAAGINSVILMFNKEYDVAKKEDKILEDELEERTNDDNR